MPKKTSKPKALKEVEKVLASRPIGVSDISAEECSCGDSAPVERINEITESFGNGELNVLRDKINEIIKKRIS